MVINKTEPLVAPNKAIRLGVLVSHPIQYFVPVYQGIAKHPNIDLVVIYRTRLGVDTYHDPGFGQLVKWDIPLLNDYSSHFLSSKVILKGIELNIIKELFSRRLDVLIVHGYNSKTNLLAIIVAKWMGVRLILRGDNRLDSQVFKTMKLKQWIKRILFKSFDGFLAIGRLNHAYFANFGVPTERICFAPFCVNNDSFSSEGEMRSERRRLCRTKWGIPDNALVVLFASKLSPRKRPIDLINAYSTLIHLFPNAWLLLVGSGEDEGMLRARVAELQLSQVVFVGFQNQSFLPSIYAASDCFVLPADSEPWGLVVNEVMAAGLPVIVSDEVGCGVDLVEGRGTGFVYPCGDVDALAKALTALMESETLRYSMGKTALRMIKDWDVNTCVTETIAAVRRVL